MIFYAFFVLMFTGFIELVTSCVHIGYQNTIIFAIQW